MTRTISGQARARGTEFVEDRPPMLAYDDLPTEAFHALASEGIVACDIETTGLDWSNDRIATFQVYGKTAGAYVVRLGGAPPIRLSRLLAEEGLCKVFHHAPFDLRFVLAQWGVRTSNVKCTKVASKLIFRDLPAEAHSLKELLRRVADVDISKEERLSNWLDDDLSGEQIEYAAKDVMYLIPLLEVLESLAGSKGLLELLDRCFAHIPTRAELDVLGYEDIYAY